MNTPQPNDNFWLRGVNSYKDRITMLSSVQRRWIYYSANSTLMTCVIQCAAP